MPIVPRPLEMRNTLKTFPRKSLLTFDGSVDFKERTVALSRPPGGAFPKDRCPLGHVRQLSKNKK